MIFRSMSIPKPARVPGKGRVAPGVALPTTALDFTVANGQAESDIALVFDGANLLPRLEHTAIWRFKPHAQTSYRSVAWHSPNLGWDTWDGGVYSWGTGPYPVTLGGVYSTGASLKLGGTDGADSWWEQAGLGVAGDFLTSPGGVTGLQLVAEQWYVQVRKCRIIVGGADDGMTEHIFIPDLIGNPSFVIRQFFYDKDSGNIPISGVYPNTPGANPAYYYGASDWRAGSNGAGTNDETINGVLCGIQHYSAFLSDTDHALEAANSTSNTPVTAAGLASVHYMNQNPTPSDVTDKSGAGHNPTWRNAYRPSLVTL